MMNRVTQTARDWKVQEKHSENIKPYLADPDWSYPGLDDLWPTPFPFEFPPMDTSEWSNINPVQTALGGCAISCNQIRGCDQPIKCYFMRVSPEEASRVEGWSIRPHISYDASDILDWKTSFNWPTSQGDIEYERDAGVARLGEIWINPPDGDWSNLYAQMNPPSQTFIVLKVQFRQSDGSTCEDLVSVLCSPCENVTPVVFDDESTPDTIAPGGSITVTVTGGLGPFYWSVSGATGYYFVSNLTEGRTNLLICADGDCDSEYDPYVTITITDNCDNQCSGTIQSTASQWCEDFNYSIGFGGACNNCGDTCRPANYGETVYILEENNHYWSFELNYNCVWDSCEPYWATLGNPAPPEPCDTAQNCIDAYAEGPCEGAGCTGAHCSPDVALLTMGTVRRSTRKCSC